MCTLIALHRCQPDVRHLIAANRDEYLDRPAAPPMLRDLGGRTVLAPRDLRAGGTWLGLNASGLFVALTNRPTENPDRSRRSRGLLVEDALAQAGAREAAMAASRLPRASYNPFNLFVSDGDEAFVVVYDDAPELVALGPGVHVIGNADPDDRRHPKVARLLAEAEQVAAGPDEGMVERLADVCRGHGAGGGPFGDTCIHTEAYGTRSSTLLRRGRAPGSDLLRFADGPPCQTDYEDLTPLLGELDRQAGATTQHEQRNVA